MKVIQHFARIIVGLIFIFSGFVKGIDPWGSAYKFSDYFLAMNLEWLQWAAFPLGVLLSLVEFTIGAALLFNTFIKLFSWLALLFMLFFTGLTLWIALNNPVTDCGCFGDAWVLTNWETFYKNVVLLILTGIIFYRRKITDQIPGFKTGLTLSIIFVLIYVSVVFYSYNHLPVIDFRPYKTGTDIREAMAIPADAPRDEYDNIFYYRNKNTGDIEKFTEENYPWQDSVNYEFHDMQSVLVRAGYEPPIHNFRVETPEGDNVLEFFMDDENYVFMVITWDLEKAHKESQQQLNKLANLAFANNMQFIGLTSSLSTEIQAFSEKHSVPYEYFHTDEITLKTIIRSNPGLMVIKDGVIVNKYHYNDIPTTEQFKQEFIN
ncbi:MAG TPA: BT_3928 family protein [Mariniphaga sp.]|nr:BT_3928 family protein [Mariniphaga sp.]